MNSIITTKSCTVSVSGYPDKAFAAGETVQPNSVYYRPLLWSGLATDSGTPGSSGPAPQPYEVLFLQRPTQDGVVPVWSATDGKWTVAAAPTGSAGDGLYLKGIFVDSVDDIPPGLSADTLVVVRGASPVPDDRQPPVVVGTPTSADSAQNTVTSLTIAKPAGLQAGDVLVAALRSQSSTATSDFASAGFTRQGPVFAANNAAARLTGFFTHRVTNPSAEPADYTFTYSGGGGRCVGILFVVRGVDPTTLLAGYQSNGQGTEVTNGRTAAAYAVETPALQLTLGANENTGSNPSTPTVTPAGHTLIGERASSIALGSTRTSIWVGYRALPTGESTAAASMTWAATSSEAVHSLALKGV